MKSKSNNKGFHVPNDLAQLDRTQIVGQSSTAYGKRGAFVTRTDIPVAEPVPQTEAGAKSALTEHRQPPDSQYLTTGLPSKGYFYVEITDNSLGIRRFNNEDVLKIYDARAEKSIRMMAEVLGATLDNFSVWDLTVGDFWYLMYWHRLHSYPKNPFIVNWSCVAEAHLDKIKAGDCSVSTIEQEMILKRSDLQIIELDEEAIEVELQAIKAEYGTTVTVMRMGDYVRMIEMEEENDVARAESIEATGKAALRYKASDFLKARHASNLSSTHGKSLEDRMTALSTLADFSLWPKLDRVVALSDHGVVETYGVKCKECGTKTEVEVALDALTFLPEL